MPSKVYIESFVIILIIFMIGIFLIKGSWKRRGDRSCLTLRGVLFWPLDTEID